jgi:phospholipid/cholesterol/gamma-HCH transport system ATP-binding protein
LIKEITEEYDITTVINTHDMNSVMEIGERILFLKDGLKVGRNQRRNFQDNQSVIDFVYFLIYLRRLEKRI